MCRFGLLNERLNELFRISRAFLAYKVLAGNFPTCSPLATAYAPPVFCTFQNVICGNHGQPDKNLQERTSMRVDSRHWTKVLYLRLVS